MGDIETHPRIEQIDRVAPALRVLLGEPNAPALVRWQSEPHRNAIVIDARTDVSDTIEAIRTAIALAPKPVAVTVTGIGTFVASQPEPPGRVAGKVAFVTGAAQGFGAGIAEGLAAQGAYVVVADMNVKGAEETAHRINETVGAARCIGLSVNVTDSGSLQEAMRKTVLRFGGIDIVVSNAGVLKAGSVKTQPVQDFEFVTRVNYTGYFLVVQHAAPIMAALHAADPRLMTDVIQINSKSGLEGSNKNGAYAGSKFGGIGLTQSFALELIQDGIKVNSICPGNFFDGPLWSDPENGLFAQYLRAGKVPGAQTTDDVRRFYEAKVPMGRGCTVPDVLRAIYYLVEQQYETGQALPVTGGQVMLN
ncbi:MAG: SDR family NAD(P)-dependent oxidoreductase [Fimbriimonas sp.]|nr:SDR family NAD(P)-dependent oxidoreductase [Fimbriimonas sp.]